MVSTRRNFNLEEINTDLVDIPYVKNQTFLQKVIFFGGIIVGIALLIVFNIVLHLPQMVCGLIFIAFAFVGALFGCNYNQDLTLFQYIKYKFSHSEKYLPPVSTEDAKYIEGKEKAIEAEDQKKARALQTRDPQESKRMLRMLIIIATIFAVGITGLFIFTRTRKTDPMTDTHRIVVEETPTSSSQ